MDFDTAKENILPLKSGRRADLMETALGNEREILEQEKKRMEDEINNYEGNDPLEPWYNYICWIEQSYFKSGNDGGLQNIIQKCIVKFENDKRYKQDRRLVKLFIKYIDTRSNPQELYLQLYNNGIGTMVADLYIGWSYYYDVANDYKKTEAIFQKGIDAGAQPYNELVQAHQAFSASIAKRILMNNDEISMRKFQETMDEKRYALTRLNAQKNKHVGSIRTGIAVKHDNPGKYRADENQGTSVGSSSQKFLVHEDDASAFITTKLMTTSSVGKSILESAKINENEHEPGPWNKAKIKSGKGLFAKSIVSTHLNFNILEDDEIITLEPIPCSVKRFEKGINIPPDFIIKNKPQNQWIVPITITESVVPNSIPRYDKFSVYPKIDVEISLEEIRGYKWFKSRNLSSKIIDEYDSVLCNKAENNARIFPGFITKNISQTNVKYPITKANSDGKFMFPIEEMVTEEGEVSNEELLAKKWIRGEIKLVVAEDFEEFDANDDMEITLIGERRQSIYPLSRKSIVPRKSILRKSVYNIHSDVQEDNFTKNIPRFHVHFEESNSEEQSQKSDEENKDGSSNSVAKKRRLNGNPDEDEEVLEGKGILCENNEETLKAPLQNNSPVSENVFKLPLLTKDFNIRASDGDENAQSCNIESEIIMPPPPPPFVEKKNLHLTENAEDEANETCSTIQFNLFIKQQSVSTPIGKKNVPKLVPLSNPQTPTLPSSPFEIYKDDNKNEVVSENLNSEHSGTSIFHQNAVPKQLSTIMEVTETTQSTKSSVSSVNDIETQVGKANIKTTPTEMGKFLNLSVFRIPEEQTETMQFNNLKLLSLPKTPGKFLESETLQDFMELNKQDRSIHHAQQSFINIPTLDFSLPGDSSINVVKDIQLPLNDVSNIDTLADEKQVSHIEIPATQDLISDDAKHGKSVNYDMLDEKKYSCFEMSRQLQIENETEISHVEIPATQEITSSEKIETTQENNGFKFAIYEDTECKTLPIVSIKPHSAKHDDSNNFHVSRKENYAPKNEIYEKRRISDEFLYLCSNSNAQETEITGKTDKEISDLLKFSDAKPNKTLESSFNNLKIDQQSRRMRSPSPTMNILDEDLNTQKFSLLLTSDKNSTVLCETFQKPNPILTNKPESKILDLSIELDENESSRLNDNGSAKKVDVFFKVPEIPPPKLVTSLQEVPKKNEGPKFEIFEDPIDEVEEEQDDDLSRTIYYNNDKKKNREEEAEKNMHSWGEEEMMCSFIADSNNRYEHTIIQEMNVSTKLREVIIQSNGNPFCSKIRNCILEQCNFEQYLEEHVETCTMLKSIPKLKSGTSFESGNEHFKVLKFIAKGSFGSVFSVRNLNNNEMFAAKQERPANLYEYFICMELSDRLREKKIDHMLPAFMQIHQAIIANNASIFITEFSPYGTIIDVCNKIKNVTGRNVEEYIGMIFTSQLLSIIDFLHACNIIHADIKPDNFLLMSKIEFGMKVPALQLIDFGSAIDMISYTKDDVFNYVVETENFTCCEMRENKPWTYQTDLFGICGTAHVILFGKYMDVEKRLCNWQITTKFPRYFQKSLWDLFFNTLLNVPNCKTMPNLQQLKQNFDEEVFSREKYVNEKIIQFNNAISS